MKCEGEEDKTRQDMTRERPGDIIVEIRRVTKGFKNI